MSLDAALAVPAHAALLLLQASEMLDRPLTELGLDNLLAIATQTRFGQVWLGQSLLLSAALTVARERQQQAAASHCGSVGIMAGAHVPAKTWPEGARQDDPADQRARQPCSSLIAAIVSAAIAATTVLARPAETCLGSNRQQVVEASSVNGRSSISMLAAKQCGVRSTAKRSRRGHRLSKAA